MKDKKTEDNLSPSDQEKIDNNTVAQISELKQQISVLNHKIQILQAERDEITAEIKENRKETLVYQKSLETIQGKYEELQNQMHKLECNEKVPRIQVEFQESQLKQDNEENLLLKKDLLVLNNQVEEIFAIKESLAYNIYYNFKLAFTKPGRNTMALPVRLGKLFYKSLRTSFAKKDEDREYAAPIYTPFTPKEKKYFEPPYIPKPQQTFYLLHSSLPWISNGYGTRSHGLLTAMKEIEMDVTCFTRLGFPVDFSKLNLTKAPENDLVGMVTYHRLPTTKYPYLRTRQDIYLQQYIEALIAKAQQYKPSILHACSNYVNALAAAYAAKILGIPSVYECRGLWEITRLTVEPEYQFTRDYLNTIRHQTNAFAEATAVIAITSALKDFLVAERGVDAEKITVVPNGVDGARFTPRTRDKELEAKFNFQNKTVIGFVGSFVDYEGLDLLLQAAAILHTKRNDFRLLLVGDGAAMETLKRQSQKAGLSNIVKFTGRVPHSEVERYYSLIDIAPFPRKAFLVCELISPLKPFEAMAMEKVVVASSVAALAEIVNDGVTGLIHQKNDAASLASVLEQLLDNPELRTQLAKTARQWVLNERDWKHSAAIIKDLYANLVVDYI